MENIYLEKITKNELKILVKEAISEVNNNIPNTDKAINSKYLTRKEVAKLFNISLTTLNERTKQGNIQAYRIGNRVLYKLNDVDNSLIQVKNLKYKRGVI